MVGYIEVFGVWWEDVLVQDVFYVEFVLCVGRFGFGVILLVVLVLDFRSLCFVGSRVFLVFYLVGWYVDQWLFQLVSVVVFFLIWYGCFGYCGDEQNLSVF